MPRKKIVFVIVEGPSDETALGVILNRILTQNAVYVHIMHCDITTERSVTPNNILSRIGQLVRNYAKNNSFKQSDFYQIVHITDMDGAFIPDSQIMEINRSESEKPLYFTTEIHTCDKPGIEDRNRRKRENLNRLIPVPQVWKIPYHIYYMSCNLDHALYGKLNSTPEEKEHDAYQFAQKYKENIPAFLHFISDSDFCVTGSYITSWKYIQENLHSLERHTNLGLFFAEQKQ